MVKPLVSGEGPGAGAIVVEALLHNMLTEKNIDYAEDERSHWVVGFRSAIEHQKEGNTCETSLKKQTSKVLTSMQMN